jgi:hypothetical protein
LPAKAIVDVSRTAIAPTRYDLVTGPALEMASWINHRIPNAAAIAIEINTGK